VSLVYRMTRAGASSPALAPPVSVAARTIPTAIRRPQPRAERIGGTLRGRSVLPQTFTVVTIICHCRSEAGQPGAGPNDPPATRVEPGSVSRRRRLPPGRRRTHLGGRADLRGEQHCRCSQFEPDEQSVRDGRDRAWTRKATCARSRAPHASSPSRWRPTTSWVGPLILEGKLEEALRHLAAVRLAPNFQPARSTLDGPPALRCSGPCLVVGVAARATSMPHHYQGWHERGRHDMPRRAESRPMPSMRSAIPYRRPTTHLRLPSKSALCLPTCIANLQGLGCPFSEDLRSAVRRALTRDARQQYQSPVPKKDSLVAKLDLPISRCSTSAIKAGGSVTRRRPKAGKTEKEIAKRRGL